MGNLYKLDNITMERMSTFDKEHWRQVLDYVITQKSFEDDMKNIKSFKYNYVILNIIKTLEVKEYTPIINSILKKDKKQITTNLDIFIIKFVTNSLKICWRKSKTDGKPLYTPKCILCNKIWQHPTRHLLISCQKLQLLYHDFRFGGREFGDFDIDKFRKFLKNLYSLLCSLKLERLL